MLGTAAAFSAPPAAPAAAKPPADDAAKVAAAREFIILYHPRMDPAKTKDMLDRGMANAIAHAKQGNPKLDAKKFEQDTRTRIMGAVNKSLDLQSRVVARNFTMQELQDLIKFFKSPLGQKLTAVTPTIVREVLQEKREEGGAPQNGGPKFKMLPPGAAPTPPAQKTK
ncbi:MAG TPA: DUF2059 domain-containing protein [Rhizomicrobium sp.]|nr:DUF2059 domain-containing protein [Rhizomicrobium sp.]